MSCRALGQGLDDALVTAALQVAAGEGGIDSVVFAHATGPETAGTWLARYSGRALGEPSGTQQVAWDGTERSAALDALPIEIRKES